MENKRMTWSEIVAKYPDQWVGLTDVVWGNEGSSVESAVVRYSDKSRGELLMKQIDGEISYSTYTTPENLIWNLASGVINYADRKE